MLCHIFICLGYTHEVARKVKDISTLFVQWEIEDYLLYFPRRFTWNLYTLRWVLGHLWIRLARGLCVNRRPFPACVRFLPIFRLGLDMCCYIRREGPLPLPSHFLKDLAVSPEEEQWSSLVEFSEVILLILFVQFWQQTTEEDKGGAESTI